MRAEERSIRERIVGVAAAMVEGHVDLVDGCRRAARLRGSLPEPDRSDPDLLVLVAVDSELDDVPRGSARALWEPDALAARDQEAAEYLDAARAEVLRACRALREKWA